jgi:fluoride exporter
MLASSIGMAFEMYVAEPLYLSFLNFYPQLIDGIIKVTFTLTLSLASTSYGAHLACIIATYVPPIPSPNLAARYSLTILALLTYAAAFPAYFLLPTDFRHKATAALLFSYPGTLTRYCLSIQLNPLGKIIPLGTFTSNALGTALLGAFTVLQHMVTPPSQNACGILQGLSDGYCGCLTTVSTFAVEVETLKTRKAWLYAVISLVTGQALLLVIMGSAIWTGHAREQATC